MTIDYDAGTNVFTLDGEMTAGLTVIDIQNDFEAGTYNVGYFVQSGSMDLSHNGLYINIGNSRAFFVNGLYQQSQTISVTEGVQNLKILI